MFWEGAGKVLGLGQWSRREGVWPRQGSGRGGREDEGWGGFSGIPPGSVYIVTHSLQALV